MDVHILHLARCLCCCIHFSIYFAARCVLMRQTTRNRDAIVVPFSRIDSTVLFVQGGGSQCRTHSNPSVSHDMTARIKATQSKQKHRPHTVMTNFAS